MISRTGATQGHTGSLQGAKYDVIGPLQNESMVIALLDGLIRYTTLIPYLLVSLDIMGRIHSVIAQISVRCSPFVLR